jgi:tRNA (cytosine49-C5)-methyltransferase
MGKKSVEDKILIKKQQWVERTAAVLHVSEVTTKHLLSIPRKQSVRINPLKADVTDTVTQLKELEWSGTPVDWSKGCYTVQNGLQAIRDSDLAINGAVYIQNAASWLPVLALDPQPGEHVLDICAAPGGKTSHIAAMANNEAYITANDNSRPRLAKLRSNLVRLGVKNVEYTLYDAAQLSRKLKGQQFDKILLDAPCSGEGMMTLDNDKDFNSWSVAQIKRLQQLQKRILVQAWQLLKPGGTLVYSTCTMAPEENEAVIDYLLRHNADAWTQQMKFSLPNRVSPAKEWNGKQFNDQLKFAMRLIPSPEIEAFFVCKLVKSANLTLQSS